MHIVMVYQELVKEYKRRNVSPRCMMKVDIREVMTRSIGVTLEISLKA